MSFKDHVIEGRDSGYSYIDICWFFIRCAFFEHVIGRYPHRDEPFMRFEFWQSKEYQHIVNPLTWTTNKLMGKYPIYSLCLRCNWTQYGKSTTCRRCK